MPTKRVCIEFNPKLTSPSDINWLKYNDDELLKDENYIFFINRKDIGEIPGNLLIDKDNRWFHCEFWSEDKGIENYTRKALFGRFKDVGSKRGFFIQTLTYNNQTPNSPSKAAAVLKSLESELKEKATDLRGSRSKKEIKADISWHELEPDWQLCPCFTDINEEASARGKDKRRDERLQSLGKARPIGRIYFMYCFSLDDYIAAETKGPEEEIIEFYKGDNCKLEEKTFEVIVSKEDYVKEIANDEKPIEYIEPVRVDRREKQLNDDGIDFSIFRTKLRNSDWLINKTYRLTIPKENNVEYFLRLSKTGLIEVRQEMPLTGEKNKTLVKILEGLLRFRRVDTTDEHDYTNMALELNSIVDEFVKYIITGYETTYSKQGIFKSKKDKSELNKKDRDRRYVAIVLRDLKCGHELSPNKPCGLSIRPSDVHRNIGVVSSFLEGTLTYNEKSNELKIPSRPSRTRRELPDLSSWSEELCFFESDRALIYFEPKTILESYNHVANYKSYWRAIVRGIEHQLSIRTCLQKMETQTTKLTNKIPKLLLDLDASRDIVPAHRSEALMNDEYTLDNLASDVAKVVSLLPELRQISTTATAFRSGKAINKFDRLGRVCFQFPEMIRNIQQNVNELGDFLQYAKAQELRKTLINLEEIIKEDAKSQHDEAQESLDAINVNLAAWKRISSFALLSVCVFIGSIIALLIYKFFTSGGSIRNFTFDPPTLALVITAVVSAVSTISTIIHSSRKAKLDLREQELKIRAAEIELAEKEKTALPISKERHK